VTNVIDKSRSRRGSAIFDPTKYPQLDEERFNELKKAFLIFDKEAKGNIGIRLRLGLNPGLG